MGNTEIINHSLKLYQAKKMNEFQEKNERTSEKTISLAVTLLKLDMVRNVILNHSGELL